MGDIQNKNDMLTSTVSAPPIKPPVYDSVPAYDNYSSSSGNGSSNKLWFLVFGVAVLVILLLIGGYFAVKVLSHKGNSSPETNSSLMLPSGENVGVVEVTLDNDSGNPPLPPTDDFSLGFVEGSSGAEVQAVNGSSVPDEGTLA